MSCLKCGSNEDLTVHHVVPQAFTKHFPEGVYRYDAGSDLAILCDSCHVTYERDRAKVLSYRLSVTYRLPITPPDEAVKESLRKKAKAIQQFANRIPAETLEQYKQDIIAYFGELDLEGAINLRQVSAYPYQFLVTQITDYEEFANLWRNDFQRFLRRQRKT